MTRLPDSRWKSNQKWTWPIFLAVLAGYVILSLLGCVDLVGRTD